MTQIDYPFHFEATGRTALTDRSGHIRDMIEQFLFTNPGERVNRPEFGGGLLNAVFEPNGEALASTLRRTGEAGLQQYLGDLITVQVVVSSAQEGVLRVEVRYLERRTGAERTERFERKV